MNSTSPVRKFFVKLPVFFVLLAAPAFVGAQKKNSSPPPKSAPAPAPKAPAANNSGAAQHGSGNTTGNTGRGGTGTSTGNTGRGGTGTSGNTGRGGTGTGNTGRGGTSTGTTGRGGTGTGAGNTGRGGTSTGAGGNAGGKPGTVPSTGANADHGKTGTTASNTGNHSVTYAGRPGDTSKPLAGGGKEFHGSDGRTVRTNKDGEVRRIETPHGAAGDKMVINRDPRGGRVVETGRPGARVVSYGPNRGFVERRVVGRPGYMSRTYVVGGRSYAHVYREYGYRGGHYYRYVPSYYYGARFYGWAETPWAAPVHYAWFGMATPAPWFGFYAGYFTPAPVYASPDLWLTDYMISENLKLSYQNQQATNGDQSAPPNSQTGGVALTPEMKQMIANEVKQQIDAERAAAAQPTAFGPAQTAPGGDEPPPALKEKFFIVSSNLDVATAQGQPCSLTPGDVIQRRGADVGPDGGVAVEVVSAKAGDCGTDSAYSLKIADLQDMHNQFHEQLDAGLKVLADNQAKGLPTVADAGPRPVPNGTAVPVADAQTQLATQDADAVKIEASVKQTGSSN